MKSEAFSSNYTGGPWGFLLLTNPRKFFMELSGKNARPWRNLLVVSLVATVLNCLGSGHLNAGLSAPLFFLNAVGMTCIFATSVFVFTKGFLNKGGSLGSVFAICVYASLGPILISWIPGGAWIGEPWRWWLSAVGLSVCMPAGTGKSVLVVGLAVTAMFVMFRLLLSVV